MPLQSSSFEEAKFKPNERIQINDSSLAPEKQFEPWISPDHEMSNRVSISARYLFSFKVNCVVFLIHSVEPSNTSYFTRSYGWDEIEQNEEETKQLRRLLSIWDAERLAILKLQHDLDKNIFQRKRMYEIIKHRL